MSKNRLFNEYEAYNDKGNELSFKVDKFCQELIDFCCVENIDLRDASLIVINSSQCSFAEAILIEAFKRRKGERIQR